MPRFSIKSLLIATAVIVSLTTVVMWGAYSARQAADRVLRIKKLKMLYNALRYYAHEHDGLPPAQTTDSAGVPVQSWRVLLLPYLEGESLYSQVDLEQSWDSPSNRRLLAPIPESFQHPAETDANGTNTVYFAVVGPDTPWWDTKDANPWENDGPNAVLLIELTGLKVPWMKPWDPTLDEVLEILRPDDANQDSWAGYFMYVTVDGDIGTVDKTTVTQDLHGAKGRPIEAIDRESLRKMLLGQDK